MYLMNVDIARKQNLPGVVNANRMGSVCAQSAWDGFRMRRLGSIEERTVVNLEVDLGRAVPLLDPLQRRVQQPRLRLDSVLPGVGRFVRAARSTHISTTTLRTPKICKTHK